MVMAHHLGASAVASALARRGHGTLALIAETIGSSGVELFFVLSAVVLVRPSVRHGRPLVVSTYARRRLERLYPPYFAAWLVSGLSMYLVTRFPSWWTEVSRLPRFRIEDWLQQLPILYYGNRGFNIAWWSLNTEILFYILVPLLVPLVARMPARVNVALVVLASTIAVAILVPFLSRPYFDTIHFRVAALVLYASCFAAGLVLARVDLPARIAYGMMAVGVVVVIGTAYVPALLSTHVGYGLLYAGVVSRALDESSVISRKLDAWHLVWLGERSYSLFLVHGAVVFMVFLAASHFFASSTPAYLLITRLLVPPLAILLTMPIFSYIERPFARGLVTGDHFWPLRERPVYSAPLHTDKPRPAR